MRRQTNNKCSPPSYFAQKLKIKRRYKESINILIDVIGNFPKIALKLIVISVGCYYPKLLKCVNNGGINPTRENIQRNNLEQMVEPDNYTPEIKSYLCQSRQICTEILSAGLHGDLIDIGCGDQGFSVNINSFAINFNNISYHGIDINAESIRKLKSSIQRTHCHRLRASIHDGEKIYDFIKENRLDRVLTSFPFNVLGLRDNPKSCIESAIKAKSDILIYTYSLSRAATKIRKNYYKNCGFKEIKTMEYYEGILISSNDGLRSWAYSQRFLQDLFSTTNYVYLVGRFGNIGVFIYASSHDCDKVQEALSKKLNFVRGLVIYGK
jgi:hypothetical protein